MQRIGLHFETNSLLRQFEILGFCSPWQIDQIHIPILQLHDVKIC